MYQEWVPDIEEPMKPVKELRGEFLVPLGCATLFGGLSLERQVLKLHSVPSTWASHATSNRLLLHGPS